MRETPQPLERLPLEHRHLERRHLERPIPWRDLVPLLLAAAGLCLVWVTVELRTLGGRLGFPLDDAWIHLAFARRLAEGQGLAINPGDLVAGSTAPLWTALLAVVLLLPGSAAAWTQGLGALLHLATVALTWRLTWELGAAGGGRHGGWSRGAVRALAALAALWTAGTAWLLWGALGGMEIPLFTSLSLGGLLLAARERRRELASAGGGAPAIPLSLGVFGLAALARPEGALLLALAIVDRLLRFDRSPENAPRWLRPSQPRVAALIRGAGLALVALLPLALFHLVIGGSVLPTTYAVKAGEGGGSRLPDLQYLYVVLGILFRAQPWSCLLAAAGAALLVGRLGTPADRGLLPALWLAGLPLAYGLITAPGSPLVGNFGRYYFPLFPVLAVLGALGVGAVLAPWLRKPLAGDAPASSGRGRLLRFACGALLAAFLLWPTAAFLPRGADLYARNLADVARSDGAMAEYLAPRLPPEATVAVVDLGAVAWHLPNRLVDLAGIATPEARRAAAEATAAGRPYQVGLGAYLTRERPDYLLTFPAWLDPPPNAGFERLHSVSIDGNITMAGDELVLYATPWNRHPLREP